MKTKTHVFNLFFSKFQTDDKGVFSTTLSKEYALLQKYFHLNQLNLWKINFKSIDHSFSNDFEKEKLRVIMCDWKTKHMEYFQ